MKCSDNYFPPLCTWEIPNSEVLGLRMGRNGQMELDRTVPTKKTGPPRKVDHFFRNFSGWTEPIHWKRHLAGFSQYMIKQQSIVLGETQDLSVLIMPRSEPRSSLKNNALKNAWSRANTNRPDGLTDRSAIFQLK